MTQEVSDQQKILDSEQHDQTLRNLLDATLESSPDGIILVDDQGKIRAVNQAFKDLYGFQDRELIGMDAHTLRHSAASHFGPGQDLERFLSENLLSDAPAVRHQLELVKPEQKTISIYSRPVVDRDGKALGRISVHSDVSAEKKVADVTRELEAAYRKVQEAQSHLIQSEKMASLGLLVAGIAHEINTPIGSINSNNDILIRSVSKMRDFLNCDQCPSSVRNNPDVVKIMGILEEINRNNRMACDRIMEIIRSLKNFARLDEGERRKVNIHQGLDSTLTLVHHQLKNRIHVVKEYGDLPEIDCYPNQLNQVFMNIFVNAEQAMPERGTLTIKTFREGNMAKILISDTGVGIPKEDLAKIFDPGFTTKAVGVGTGLGLSICYKIIQDHHGRIEVDSEVGKGTTFTISLPIQV
jgi:two-component system, NtrC family, sensor kinase